MVTHFLTQHLSHWGYVFVFALTVISSLGIPVGSELAIGFGGAIASGAIGGVSHHMGLAGVIVAAFVGEIVGSSAGYLLGRFGGRPIVDKLGRYVLLSHKDLNRVERLFTRFGDPLVLVGRLVPLLRSFVSLAAGLGEMKIKQFYAYSVLGCGAWVVALSVLGYELGNSMHHIIKRLQDAGLILLIIFVVVLVAGLAHRIISIRRERRPA